ncbi:MAG: ribosome maturation factor RimP [Actinobacteria bacterium]|nr:ribosome maturation factor RimP [Actinomycetota bacterium]
MTATSSGSTGDLPGRVAALVGPVAEAQAVELVDVEVKGQGNRRLVRLVADADGGLDVDRIASLSRAVGDVLDTEDVIPGGYTLEVTSPGADRPMRSARDFRRNVGREIRVVRTEEAASVPDVKGEVRGTLVAADDEAVRLEVDGETESVALAEIDHGKVVLPW